MTTVDHTASPTPSHAKLPVPTLPTRDTMAHVRVYTTPICPYCVAAKRFLRDVKRVDFEEIDVAHQPELRTWLVQTTGQRTVPQIFIGDRPVGGYTDLRALDAAGGLDPLLQA